MFQITLLLLSAVLAVVAMKATILFAPLLIALAPVIAKVALVEAGIIALVGVVEDFWVAFRGSSVFELLWQKMNSFFAPVEKRLCEASP